MAPKAKKPSIAPAHDIATAPSGHHPASPEKHPEGPDPASGPVVDPRDHTRFVSTFTKPTELIKEEFEFDAAGNDFCMELVDEIAEAATAQYLERHYNRLAVDYTVLSLWDEMTLAVQGSLIQQDTGTKFKDATATWEADEMPSRIECDVHSRHIIPFRKDESRPSTQEGSATNKDLSPANVNAMFTGSGNLRAQRKSNAAALGLPNQGRPTSSGHSAAGTPGFSGSRRSMFQGSSRNIQRTSSTKPGAGEKCDNVDGESPTTPADNNTKPKPDAKEVIELTADELQLLQEIRGREEHQKHLRAVEHQINAQLADTKLVQKGFVIDANSGKVIPMLPLEDLSRRQDVARYNVNEPSSTAPAALPEKPSTAPAGPRSTVGAAAKKPNSRRDDNYFVPEQQGVAMVINLTPSGGVGVKEGDSGSNSKRADLKLPKNKISRDEYKRMVAQPVQPNPTDSPSSSPLEPPADGKKAPQTARLGSAPVGGKDKKALPLTARNKESVPIPPPSTSDDSPSVVREQTAGQTIKPQPTAVRPSPRPPPRGMQQRAPRAAHVPPTPSRDRGSIRRSARAQLAAASGTDSATSSKVTTPRLLSPRRPTRVKVANMAALDDDVYGGDEQA